MDSFSRTLQTDSHGKASTIKLFSFARPHMRALHLGWISFMTAFLAWYSIPPLISIIQADLGLSATDVYDSNVVAVAATIAARLFVGPLCERFGPRKVMAGLLLVGAIPTAMVGLVKTAGGLIALRFFIGILGATFVPCQFWATQMFSSNVVGTANALAGGWGNSHIPNSTAWKAVYIIPAGMCILVSLVDIFFSDDCPEGKWHSVRQVPNDQVPPPVDVKNEDMEKMPQVAVYEDVDNTDDDTISLSSVNSHKTFATSVAVFFKTLIRPPVLILLIQYACSFGLELSVDNIIAALFHNRFQLSLTSSSYVGSVFGLMNLFSRLSGGLFADYLFRKWKLPGRILAQIILLTCEGCFLIGFSYSLGRLDSSIGMMVLFSFFVQASCGSTFALAPYVDPENSGTVMGIIGAGGSLGGLCFNFLFKSYGLDYHSAFLILGIVALVAGIPGSLLLRVQGRMLYNLRSTK
ncbi:hypothetical protein K450DRAFT_251407 [Umbelopsis ramanniana AG]|uniref:Major facilitator superfamily (MFS) profile domain-containing protein n=1 Tax=Umbelopsis ramanniana AG TaxID=1314678 RepID=A0AAD5E8H3_UMBRA|nr:uncharacterized protein K450DRAFT_251407 [Umbelopsis ramanniana AG]KAI8577555.1 hypothetical protein K450DRAFT_251407 [Umbelopsis ramanniana AG]